MVFAAMLCAACASRGATRTSDTLSARPLPAPDDVGAALLTPLTPLALNAGGAASSATDATSPSNTSGAALELSVEEPYPIDERPRPASAVEAAADDELLARWNLGGSADPEYPSSRVSYHPGTRVVVDTRFAKRQSGMLSRTATTRGLAADRVQAQARSHGYWPFRLCFEAGQRNKRSDGGETRIAFSIGTRGRVKHAALLDSKLNRPAVAACLVRETARLEFSPPPVRALSMVASIRIWPGDAELPALPAMPPPPLATGSGFDPEIVRQLVNSRRAELAACFAEARSHDPLLWGRLALAAILEADGSVHRVSEVESHFPNAAAARCAQVTLAGIVFPSVNGKPFTLVIPLRLNPAQRADVEVGPDPADAGPVRDPADAGPVPAADDAGSD